MLKKKQFQVGLLLTAGAVLGWAAASGKLSFLPPAVARAQADEVIVFTVRLPADAVLLIDDNKTESTGDVRTFQTPPLPMEGHYAYTLKATSGGKEVTRKVYLAHGVDTTFDLRAEFRPAAAARPDPRQLIALGQGKAEPGPARQGKGDPKDEEAIAKNAEAFVAAFDKGDAEAVAALWAPDGDYTDLNGRKLQGREAIAKAFNKLFAEHKGLKVGIESLSLRFVKPELAIEDGTSEVFSPDGGPPSRSRYTIVHVKKDGQWLLGSVHEEPFTPPTNYEHLSELEWAIGNWAGETESSEVERFSLTWFPGQNFIVGSITTAFKDTPVGSASQWIGWDPLAKQIRSWMIDSTGGFGEGSWTRDGDKWVIKTSTVLQDGKKAAATHVLTRVDADTLTLQARDRSVDGHELPATKEVRLKRVK
jgi:uncharacterized protein (TIGR02246 family)